MIIASIPDIPACIASLKEDFHVSAEYSPQTGKFVVEGSLEQLMCTQVRLQEILQQQLELQKHQLRRLGSRGSHRHDPGQYSGTTDHYRDWNYHQHHGAASAAGSDYQRPTAHEGEQIPII